jgi:hypothetical protein
MAQILRSNARRAWNRPEFAALVRERDKYSRHPTDSSKYQFFCKKVAQVIYNTRASMVYTLAVLEEIAFITRIFSDPVTYRWESPIAHLIVRKHDYETFGDACLRGAGGLLPSLRFWWALEWPQEIVARAYLKRCSPHFHQPS